MRVSIWLLVMVGLSTLIALPSLAEPPAPIPAASPSGPMRGPRGAPPNHATAVLPQGAAPTATSIGSVKSGVGTRSNSTSLHGPAQLTGSDKNTASFSAPVAGVRGSNPAAGGSLRKNATSINGTGFAAKGNGPANTGARVKSGANINGTSIQRKN